MAHNILVITWSDEASAFKALSDLRAATPDNINQAIVAERQANGTLVLRDGKPSHSIGAPSAAER